MKRATREQLVGGAVRTPATLKPLSFQSYVGVVCGVPRNYNNNTKDY